MRISWNFGKFPKAGSTYKDSEMFGSIWKPGYEAENVCKNIIQTRKMHISLDESQKE